MGKVTATGDRRFLGLVGALAAELNIDVTNPELQGGIVKRRQALMEKREKADATALQVRARTEAMLASGNLIHKRDGRYAIDNERIVSHYLPDGLMAHPAAQAVLRDERERQQGLIQHLAADIAATSGRFRVGDRGISIVTEYINATESRAWLRDEGFRALCELELHQSEERARAENEELRRKLYPERYASVPATSPPTVTTKATAKSVPSPQPNRDARPIIPGRDPAAPHRDDRSQEPER